MFRNTYMEMYKSAIYAHPSLQNLMPHLHNIYATLGSALQDIEYLISTQIIPAKAQDKQSRQPVFLPSMDNHSALPSSSGKKESKVEQIHVHKSVNVQGMVQEKEKPKEANIISKQKMPYVKEVKQPRKPSNEGNIGQESWRPSNKIGVKQSIQKVRGQAQKQIMWNIKENNGLSSYEAGDNFDDLFCPGKVPARKANEAMKVQANEKSQRKEGQMEASSSSEDNFFEMFLQKNKKRG